jgi:hypothetical protein
MANFTNSKPANHSYPENCVETPYGRLEPILGYDELVNRHLLGIALVSQMLDPLTKKPVAITPDKVKDIIDGAIQQAELELKIDIFPVKRSEKYPFDRFLYDSFGHFVVRNRPVMSVDKVSVTPSNGQDVYVLPLEWLEMANAVRGQINIIPMTAAFVQGGIVPANPAGGQMFLQIMGNRGWIPAYWLIDYTSGFPDGMVPRIINEFIGTVAAMEILSQLAATYARAQSHSLSLDGQSQSVSGPGPNLFKVRMDELEAKRKKLMKQIKNQFNRQIFATYT